MLTRFEVGVILTGGGGGRLRAHERAGLKGARGVWGIPPSKGRCGAPAFTRDGLAILSPKDGLKE